LITIPYQIGIRVDDPWPASGSLFDINKQLNTTMPRIDDVQQQLQQAIDDLQSQISNQAEQMTEQLAAQREAQERSHGLLRELITGLSVQVLQLTN